MDNSGLIVFHLALPAATFGLPLAALFYNINYLYVVVLMLLEQREEDLHDLLLVVSHLLPFSLKNKEEKQSLKNAQGLEKEKSWDVNKRKKEKIEITNLEQLVTQIEKNKHSEYGKKL